MRSAAIYKHLKIDATQSEDDKTNYSIRIENTKTNNFVHFSHFSKQPLDSRLRVLVAFRNLLMAASYGAFNPASFCYLMGLDMKNPKAEAIFTKARDVTAKMDKVIPLAKEGTWLDLARELARKGLVPPLQSDRRIIT